ncbi:alpha/beta fold hydrolase [Bradyrhizobium sp. AUGA SZCCT0182]|uniref:alpha/beta fold hydrolase n=1 Tax=Bradyrhizobium sp. AUGA SZCCT0182 TaxID=2807667 RepID=UPI001BA66786|nr:alpha/beta hydrolase [Bradyrhizobium sp. AUGA SZCCT0182]
MKISMPDGCRLHVESEGHGDTPIVFLHGIMMSGAVFKRQVSALSADYRVVTVDLRGFGQSDKPETGYSGENFVADLKCVIDHLNLTRPIIAGWSMGGAIALAFAATFPGIASRADRYDAMLDSATRLAARGAAGGRRATRAGAGNRL